MRDVELVRAIYRRMVFEVEDRTQGHVDSE
jgi:hypothetical protein